MKRLLCAASAGLVLALSSAGTAAASGLPLLGQTAKQTTSLGDQTVGEQRNEADVDQYQGNGNVNVSPAIAVFGDAETANHQGNGNTATADVDQSNSVEQRQSSSQSQYVAGKAACCGSQHGSKTDRVEEKSSCCPQYRPQNEHRGKKACCGAPDQERSQKGYGGDQTVGKQENEADVTQKQGNWSGSFAPAAAFGASRDHSCASSKCGEAPHPSRDGGATTTNAQGNWNRSSADVDQSNAVQQAQHANQVQALVQRCKGVSFR